MGTETTDVPRIDLFRAGFPSDLRVREADEDGQPPVLYGHFARFNEWTEVNSRLEGHFMERFAPGAFAKTLQERSSKMRVLFQHGKDVLGQQILGPIHTLREDDEGVFYEVPLYRGIPDLIVEGLRDGQYGSSFRFRMMKWDDVRRPERSENNPDGLPERTVTEAQVLEFGPVTFPQYEGATAGIRSLTDDFMLPGLREIIALAGSSLEGRAAALADPEPDEDPGESSRSTRDYLAPPKEVSEWQL